MNEEFLKDMYSVVKEGGYPDDLATFTNRIQTDTDFQKDLYATVKEGGYPDGMSDFLGLIGAKAPKSTDEGIIISKVPEGKLSYTTPSQDEWTMPVPSEARKVAKLTPDEIEARKASRQGEFGFWKSQLFPETAQASMKDEPYWPEQGLAAAKDVFTLPLRLAMPGEDDIGYTQQEAQGFRQAISSDPTILPLLGVGTLGLPMKAGSAAAAVTPYLRIPAMLGAGAAEGAAGSVASDIVAGREVSPGSAGLGALSGGLLTAPGLIARTVRTGDLPEKVGQLAYDYALDLPGRGAKTLNEASEGVLRYAKDVEAPDQAVIAKAQDKLVEALKSAEDRTKALRKSNAVTAKDFADATSKRQEVIDNLMAEGTSLTPEALMREARRIRVSDPRLAEDIENIAVDRLWQATRGRALGKAGDLAFGLGDDLEDVAAKQDVIYSQALKETSNLPAPRALLDAQTQGAASSALLRGLPGGKVSKVSHVLDKYLTQNAPAVSGAIIPFKREN